MRHSRLAGSAAAVAASAPGVAQANAGIGLLSPGALVAIPALVPAIFVEAGVLARMLGLRYPRALWISFVANVFSTVIGAVIAIGFDVALGGGGPAPGRGLFLVSLVPMFFLSWWLELWSVRRRLPGDVVPRAPRATFAANLLTYALMAVAISFMDFPDPLLRSRVLEGMGQMNVAKMDVAEHFEKQGAFPAPGPIAAKARTVRSLSRGREGRIELVFELPESPEGNGRRLILQPRVEGGRIVEWVCYSPDMAFRYLPPACRQAKP